MKSILNGIPGQEGNAINVKGKDTFLILGFDIWIYLWYRANQINPIIEEGFSINSLLVVTQVVRFKVHSSRLGGSRVT
jgi:hypothetical protein